MKSFYRKLRLSPDWVRNELALGGFAEVTLNTKNGLVTVIATKAQR